MIYSLIKTYILRQVQGATTKLSNGLRGGATQELLINVCSRRVRQFCIPTFVARAGSRVYTCALTSRRHDKIALINLVDISLPRPLIIHSNQKEQKSCFSGTSRRTIWLAWLMIEPEPRCLANRLRAEEKSAAGADLFW